MCGPETPALAEAAVDGGADLLELGIPFSDPLADGPVVRRAGERALAQGMRTAACLDVLRETRARIDVPLIPMTYASILEAYGWERFAADARDAGATSLIVADLPAGERPELEARPARRADVDRRAAARRGGADRRLALPRHRHRDDRRPRRRLPRARRPRRARARRRPTSRSTPASASRRRSRRAPRPHLADGVVVGSRAVEVAEEGPDALRELRPQPPRGTRPVEWFEDAATAASFVRPRTGSLLEGRPARSRLRRHGRTPASRLARAVAPGPARLHVRRCDDRLLARDPDPDPPRDRQLDRARRTASAPASGRTCSRSLVLSVLRFGSNFTRRYATARVGIRVEARMRELLYQAYLRFPRAFYDQHATGQVVSRATNDLYPIRYFIGWGMVQGAQSLMMIIGVAVVLVLVNAKLALFALLAMPLVGLLAWVFAQDGDAGLAARAAAQGGRDGGRGRGGRRHRDGAGVRPRGRRARRASASRRAPCATACCARRGSRAPSCPACSSCRRCRSRSSSGSAAATSSTGT